ncbi:hypothetical protein D915_010090 [Fasciola hepatica]|uniref:Uncharacterized protein n=1 Tax=Fasciola hepatica TaxID=6192 RepID=A0A4E0RB65_FASHE|nr:hypothetical protein D915_010090 [Fasciola hepatica]
MEGPLIERIRSIHDQPGVSAVHCIGPDGLCLVSSGNDNELVCGILSSIYYHAQKIENQCNSPVVVVEENSS